MGTLYVQRRERSARAVAGGMISALESVIRGNMATKTHPLCASEPSRSLTAQERVKDVSGGGK